MSKCNLDEKVRGVPTVFFSSTNALLMCFIHALYMLYTCFIHALYMLLSIVLVTQNRFGSDSEEEGEI